MMVFGFSGGYEVGKTTLSIELSKYLEMEYNFPVRRVSLGNYVKSYCVESGFLTYDEAFQKPTTPKARFALRTTSFFEKKKNSCVWIDKCLKEIKATRDLSENTIILIDDIRFLKEAEVLKDYNLILTFIGEDTNRYNLKDLYSIADLKIKSKPDLIQDFLPEFNAVVC